MTELSQASITSVDDYGPITVGDTATPLRPQFWRWSAALTPPRYAPIDLTDLTIELTMVDASGNQKVGAGSWTKTDAQHGKAEYALAAGDVSEAGQWTLYFKLTDADSKSFHTLKKILPIESAP